MKKNRKAILIALICFVLFIIITGFVIANQAKVFDDTLYQLVYGNHNQYLDLFFTNFTHIGDTIPVICIALVLMFLFRKWKDKIMIGSSLLITVLMNQLIKHIIARPRPPLERRLIKQNGYSYPSGHSMVSMCICGLLIYIVMTRIKNKKLKVFLTIILSLMILCIGISRIYVGVHYPSDVIGGFLLSITIIIVDIILINHHLKGANKNEKSGNLQF